MSRFLCPYSEVVVENRPTRWKNNIINISALFLFIALIACKTNCALGIP